MNTAKDLAISILKPVIARAAERAVDASIGIETSDADQIAREVTNEVAAVVVNQTNNEPWYQSRVTWGAVIAVASGLAGLLGYSLDASDQATIVNALVSGASVVGGLFAWYGRWIAKKPLGQ